MDTTDTRGPRGTRDTADTLDLRPAASELARLVHGVRDDQLADPTPCTAYVVADLLDHVEGLAVAFRHAATREPLPADTVREGDGARLRAGWRERIAGRLRELAAAWSVPEAYVGTCDVLPVAMSGDQAALVALDEVVVHAWDLARATGQRLSVRPEDVAACHAFVAGFPAPDGDGPFGPPVPVDGGAPPLDRLVAATGRQPGWSR